ncbi:alpha/beta-hydrolase [Teratosphaeria nubilosa]|uniref:Alpha/beta-hydrolase n=1 Tax=Teratosphaeria nubilosa TaxID=161662 RepID=A0A6G1LBC3_9PEZI|nr:alpha/beta-hydrolase [Teratosphaeria nubilosa]
MLVRNIIRRPSESSHIAIRSAAHRWALVTRGYQRLSNSQHVLRPTRLLPNQLWTRIPTRARCLFTSGLPSILVPPVVFISLLISLWTYKCLMTILFQDRIIYMPYMPPFARSEKLETYAKVCKPVEWEEKRIRSLDGTKISLATGNIPEETATGSIDESRKDVVICYFQGNGSSTPPRLPLLSQVLKLVHTRKPHAVRFTLIALSYRGYWTSSGRASQKGIEQDAQAMLQWVAKTHPSADIVLWGQSVGAGVASTAAARYIQSAPARSLPIAGLIMETPFTSIKSMLFALYPQKWLPYQYLHPFLWNIWDSEKALRKIAEAHVRRPKLLLMPATRDEVVPAEEIERLEGVCKDLRLECEKQNVVGALHTEATTRREGQASVANFLLDVVDKRHCR